VILSVGLTPAWQQILQFDRLTVGDVNRARATHACASGKVLNVAAAVHNLGAAASLWCPVGGATGRQIAADFRKLGIPSRWLDVATPTRVCTTLLDASTGATTELVENAGALTAAELDRYLGELPELAARSTLVVLTGSLPERTPAGYYRRLMQTADRPVILDIRGQDLLDCLPLKPLLVKPNRDELGWTVGRTLSTESEILAAMHELRSHGTQWVVVSQGAGSLLASGPDGDFRVLPPRVKAVNPIGCGDSLAAGIAVGVSEGLPMIDAIRLGVAAAVENALDLLPARMTRTATDCRIGEIQIQRM
jgi:tagatose 6-phosphate kinase